MMHKYAIRFGKNGYVKYISHLDLLRVYKRAFKKADIALKYSEGFNPHPKLGFAQPLSLGYSSDCEILELETEKPYDCDEMAKVIALEMPKGIDIYGCSELDIGYRSLAGETDACLYEIYIPCDVTDEKAKALLKAYLDRDSIKAMKRMKKTKKLESVEIRDKIRNLSAEAEEEGLKLTALLDGGSHSNLSPELVIASFLEISELKVERYDIEVTRKKIIFVNNLQF